MMTAVARTLENGSPYNIELEIIRRDGSIGILRSIGEAERDENDQIVRLRGVAQDISDIKRTEAELRLALKEERSAQIYKDQFLANMSHEIRTPLNGVVGFASLLRDADLDTATRNEYIDTIESCSNQLLNLIDDILDLAKIEAGEIEITKKPIHIPTLMYEVAATQDAIKAGGDKGKLRLVTQVPQDAETLQLYSDPLRIQQILTNLLNNAFKFADEGTIVFGVEYKHDTVEFLVKDEGIGIEPARINRIFERFQHLEGTEKKYEGTGLGLSISQGLADLLGATLSVESTPGQGSLFRLKIPLETRATTPQPATTATTNQRSKAMKTITVLIAEDDETNKKLIQKILQSTPYQILWAANGEQAIQLYRQHSGINLVLMDIRMPVMHGDEAARQILKINPEAKIIAQTAYAMREEREQFLKTGFLDYIAKPYIRGEFLAMIEKWA